MKYVYCGEHKEFEAWAKDHLGQGYSLEREEGTYIDPVTRWACIAFYAGSEASLPPAPTVGQMKGKTMTEELNGAPGSTDVERAAWLADKIGALGDYAKEAAAMLRRWPSP